jgi:hypothetical protein
VAMARSTRRSTAVRDGRSRGVARDFDGDGHADIAAWAACPSVLALRAEDSRRSRPRSGPRERMLAGDVDHDGRVDLFGRPTGGLQPPAQHRGWTFAPPALRRAEWLSLAATGDSSTGTVSGRRFRRVTVRCPERGQCLAWTRRRDVASPRHPVRLELRRGRGGGDFDRDGRDLLIAISGIRPSSRSAIGLTTP